MRASLRDLTALMLGVILLSGVCISVLAIVPVYEEAYAQFDGNLERPLWLLFATSRWWLMSLVPAALLWQFAPNPRVAANRALVYCIAVAVLLGVFAWWAVQPRTLCCDISEAKPNYALERTNGRGSRVYC